jgi:hypothetical protein
MLIPHCDTGLSPSLHNRQTYNQITTPVSTLATASGRSPTTPHHRSLGELQFLSTPTASGTARMATRAAQAARVFTGGWRDVMESDFIPIARTAAGAGVVFSREERQRHLYVVGKSGSGKSTFLYNLAMGDIVAGEGVAVIDPHGDLALDILDAIPRSRINDVCYLDVTETTRSRSTSWKRIPDG